MDAFFSLFLPLLSTLPRKRCHFHFLPSSLADLFLQLNFSIPMYYLKNSVKYHRTQIISLVLYFSSPYFYLYHLPYFLFSIHIFSSMDLLSDNFAISFKIFSYSVALFILSFKHLQLFFL